mgnify:CR=1 FL=1
MASVGLNQIKRGDAIDFNNNVYVVTDTTHVKPGKGPAYVQVKMRDVVTGRIIDNRFRSADSVEKVDYDRRDCTYSYKNGDNFVFMAKDNYDEIEVNSDIIGDNAKYLVENDTVTVCVVRERVVGFELPTSIVVEVIETEPGIKNASATNVGKPATTTTGLIVTVPPFINQGDRIRVSTETGAYQERVNS